MKKGIKVSLLVVMTLLCTGPRTTRAQVAPAPVCPPICIPTVTAFAVTAATTRDTPVNIRFNATSTSGSLAYSTTTDPIHGTLGTIAGDTVAYTPSSGYVGTDTFTYLALSISARQGASVTITITGSDTVSPVITAPATQYVSTTTIPAFPALVLASAVDDTDPGPRITSDAPASFSVGTTTITWTATDAAGNRASATSSVVVTRVDPYRISTDRSTATTTEPFTATATAFDDATGTYLPASGAVIGVVSAASTTTVIATSTADALGHAVFTIATSGAYAVGIEQNAYATTSPITITEPAPAPTPSTPPTPAPGNGPPVANNPAAEAPVAVPAALQALPVEAVVSDTAPAPAVEVPVVPVATKPVSQNSPTSPVASASKTPKQQIVIPKITEIDSPAPTVINDSSQTAAAAVATSVKSAYELLGLIILLLTLAGLIWQWKRRHSRANGPAYSASNTPR